jgi:periplasmic copper chaperone A
MLKKLCFAAMMLLWVTHAAAEITVEQASVRATAPGQVTAMADLTLRSEKIALLIGVTTPLAESVELHLMTHDNGVMKMRAVKEVALPAGRLVKLSAEGYHLMLINIKALIPEGVAVPLQLKFQLADKKIITLDASATVKPLINLGAAMPHH